MKQQRHKHKESYSILVISNVSQKSRSFHMSRFLARLLVFLLLLLIAAVGVLSYLFYNGYELPGGALQSKYDSQAEQIERLEKELKKLNSEKLELAAEIETLQQTLDAAESGETDENETEVTEPDSSFPNRYPCIGSGMMTTAYSEEHTYLSITLQAEGQIVAAGDGAVTSVTSDDTYPVIIEMDHGNGYMTRYMCLQDADIQIEEGAQVAIGDILFIIRTDDTQLDYQITYNGEPIDPLTIIEAQG